jgi:release factor-specific protein-(glutamine-N5) methyltransferase
MKIEQALKKGMEMLKNGRNEITAPLLEAELIIAHIIGKDRVYVISHINTDLAHDKEADYLNLINMRAQGCPMAYITGRKEFMGLELYTDKSVLIPRDDTELLVRCVLNISKSSDITEILNIGSGSGCVEIALAYYNNKITVTGIEKYPEAIESARRNVDKFFLNDKITLIQSDMFTGIDKNKRFDIICSNPPYITKDEMDSLSIDVIEYEPASALYGGEDGLDYYKIIACESKKHLNPKGFIVVEIGYSQADAVKRIFAENGYKNIMCHKDLNGYDRVITAEC